MARYKTNPNPPIEDIDFVMTPLPMDFLVQIDNIGPSPLDFLVKIDNNWLFPLDFPFQWPPTPGISIWIFFCNTW